MLMKKREKDCDRKETTIDDSIFKKLLLFSNLGHLLALIGFIILSCSLSPTDFSFTTELTILSLLATGVIAGYYSFSYQKATKEELPLARKIGVCFTILFYCIFSSIAFYMGSSVEIHKSELARFIIPFIMLLILLGNTYFDFWDYLKGDKNTG